MSLPEFKYIHSLDISLNEFETNKIIQQEGIKKITQVCSEIYSETGPLKLENITYNNKNKRILLNTFHTIAIIYFKNDTVHFICNIFDNEAPHGVKSKFHKHIKEIETQHNSFFLGNPRPLGNDFKK